MSSGTAGLAVAAGAEADAGVETVSGFAADGGVLPQAAAVIAIAAIMVIRESFFMNANSIASLPVTEALCAARQAV
jgi:hypothetical protein